MKLGVIDLGTNTFNILIVEKREGQRRKQLFNSKSAVMLGRDGLRNGYLSEKILDKAYEVLSNFRTILNDCGCEQVIAFGTSALRTSKNSEAFIRKVAKELQINIEAISGDKEAEYIYYGVRDAVDFSEDNYLILDIGGGSNEFIIANKNKLLWKQSFPLGGARLNEKFKPNDPITEKEIHAARNYLNKELELLKLALLKFPVTKLVGASGAFDSFAEMVHFKNQTSPFPESRRSSVLTIEDFNTLYNDIISSTRNDRLKMQGLDGFRVDYIVMASLFTKFTLELSHVNEIIQSSYALKEGVAANYF